jgi:hypothetical protein
MIPPLCRGIVHVLLSSKTNGFEHDEAGPRYRTAPCQTCRQCAKKQEALYIRSIQRSRGQAKGGWIVPYFVVFWFEICSHLENKQLYTRNISPNREPFLDSSTYYHVDFRNGITHLLERPSILQRLEPDLPMEAVQQEVQDRSLQALSPEKEEIFRSRLSKI